MTRMPSRVRLTAWYALVLAVVLTTLGVFVVTRLRAEQTENVDRSLGSATAQLATGYREEGPWSSGTSRHPCCRRRPAHRSSHPTGGCWWGPGSVGTSCC